MSEMKCRTVFLSLLVVLSGTRALAEKPWTEVRSPHFRVLTNGSAADGRHVAHEFEQMRYVFVTQFPSFRVDSGAPLIIFAARDEATAKMLEPGIWKKKGAKPGGVFQHGWEKQTVMVRLDVQGDFKKNLIYHEYTHSILHMNSRWLPTWLDEGMAEFYGYTRFEQHKIYIGAPTALAPLLQETPIPIEKLLTMPEPLFHGADENSAEHFYAESWALVHFMVFGRGMGHGAKLQDFFQLIQQNVDQEKAFVQVFGSFAAMNKALDVYMRSMAFGAAVYSDPPQIVEKDFAVTTLTMAQTEAELAGFHIWNQDLASAKPLVEQALKDDPKLGYAHEEKGYLLFADGKDADAAEEFSQACSLDGTLYLSLFAKTMLSPIAASNAPADETAFGNALLKVVSLNPQFAPAFVQLARLAVRQNDLQTAFALNRRAEELEPTRAEYHIMTGEILLRMGKDSQAAEIAQYVAAHSYSTDHNEAVELWDRVPQAKRPAGVTLVSDKIPNSQVAVGIVKSSICADPETHGKKQPWTMVLDQDGKDLTFHTKGGFGFGFSDTLWWGENHASSCHHLDGLRAVVHYQPTTDPSYTGDIVGVDVRDDLPAAMEINSKAVAIK
jgi:tetratricopeptide (TPR) repeat protein